MTAKFSSRVWRSSASSLSRCCHRPMPWGPMKIATALQSPRLFSRVCTQERPGTSTIGPGTAYAAFPQQPGERLHRDVIERVVANEQIVQRDPRRYACRRSARYALSEVELKTILRQQNFALSIAKNYGAEDACSWLE